MIPILPPMATLETATPMQTATRPSVTTFFLRKPTMDPGEIWVKSFSLPDLHIVKPATQTHISISDHEAVASNIYLWKQ